MSSSATGASAATLDFPEPIGRQRMVRYPAGEQITVPRHIPTRNVTTLMNAAAALSLQFLLGYPPDSHAGTLRGAHDLLEARPH